jgi:hypothetical protein
MMTATPFATSSLADVTRDIPPVVYFHEQSPEKLASEVSEYIITGGWPDGHPNKRGSPRASTSTTSTCCGPSSAELDKPGGPDLPTCWISGLLRLGQVELRQAPRPRARRRRAPRRPLAGRGPGSPATPAPGAPSCATPGPRCVARSTRWPSSSTSAAPRDNEHIHARRRAPGAGAPRLLHDRPARRRLRAQARARRRVEALREVARTPSRSPVVRGQGQASSPRKTSRW